MHPLWGKLFQLGTSVSLPSNLALHVIGSFFMLEYCYSLWNYYLGHSAGAHLALMLLLICRHQFSAAGLHFKSQKDWLFISFFEKRPLCLIFVGMSHPIWELKLVKSWKQPGHLLSLLASWLAFVFLFCFSYILFINCLNTHIKLMMLNSGKGTS